MEKYNVTRFTKIKTIEHDDKFMIVYKATDDTVYKIVTQRKDIPYNLTLQCIQYLSKGKYEQIVF